VVAPPGAPARALTVGVTGARGYVGSRRDPLDDAHYTAANAWRRLRRVSRNGESYFYEESPEDGLGFVGEKRDVRPNSDYTVSGSR
jgi:hypothetical protein